MCIRDSHFYDHAEIISVDAKIRDAVLLRVRRRVDPERLVGVARGEQIRARKPIQQLFRRERFLHYEMLKQVREGVRREVLLLPMGKLIQQYEQVVGSASRISSEHTASVGDLKAPPASRGSPLTLALEP